MSELDIPESWATCNVGDVTERTLQKKPVGQFNYIDIDAVDNKSQTVTNSKPLNEKDAPSRARKEVRFGDIVYSTVRPYLKNIAKVPHVNNTIASTGFVVLRPKVKVNGDFIFHYVCSDYFLRLIEPHQKGASYPAVSDKIVFDQPIPLPPLPEQQRIVAKIESCSERIKAIESAVTKAETLLTKYRESLLAKAFRGELTQQSPNDEPASQLLARIRAERAKQQDGKKKKDDLRPIFVDEIPFDIPKSWEWVRIADVGEVKLGRQRAPQHHSGKNMRKYLRVANVFEERIDISDVYEMNFTPAEHEVFMLKSGDILLNEGQSIELVGRPAMFKNELPDVCFTNTIVRFRASAAINPDYALVVFLGYFKNGRFRKIAKAGTNIAHLGADRFARLEFPVPPLEEQKRIVTSIRQSLNSLERLTAIMKSTRAETKRMRATILQSAFSGRIVPQISSEGTGHDLLKSIQAARKEEPSKPKSRKSK